MELGKHEGRTQTQTQTIWLVTKKLNKMDNLRNKKTQEHGKLWQCPFFSFNPCIPFIFTSVLAFVFSPSLVLHPTLFTRSSLPTTSSFCICLNRSSGARNTWAVWSWWRSTYRRTWTSRKVQIQPIAVRRERPTTPSHLPLQALHLHGQSTAQMTCALGIFNTSRTQVNVYTCWSHAEMIV